jgi:hypothetical protein
MSNWSDFSVTAREIVGLNLSNHISSFGSANVKASNNRAAKQ